MRMALRLALLVLLLVPGCGGGGVEGGGDEGQQATDPFEGEVLLGTWPVGVTLTIDAVEFEESVTLCFGQLANGVAGALELAVVRDGDTGPYELRRPAADPAFADVAAAVTDDAQGKMLFCILADRRLNDQRLLLDEVDVDAAVADAARAHADIVADGDAGADPDGAGARGKDGVVLHARARPDADLGAVGGDNGREPHAGGRGETDAPAHGGVGATQAAASTSGAAPRVRKAAPRPRRATAPCPAAAKIEMRAAPPRQHGIAKRRERAGVERADGARRRAGVQRPALKGLAWRNERARGHGGARSELRAVHDDRAIGQHAIGADAAGMDQCVAAHGRARADAGGKPAIGNVNGGAREQAAIVADLDTLAIGAHRGAIPRRDAAPRTARPITAASSPSCAPAPICGS